MQGAGEATSTPRTIDTFIDVLQAPFREGPWVPPILAALKEWTGQPVKNSPASIAAFARWWKRNRAEWTARLE